jgi:hypothetical protein
MVENPRGFNARQWVSIARRALRTNPKAAVRAVLLAITRAKDEQHA